MFVYLLQLNEYNAILEVEIAEWTTAGLVGRVEVKALLLFVEVCFY